MANTRDIRRRIKSIQNTKKITKAMEMVASSKMRKAVESVLATRPYASLAWQLILNVSAKTEEELHPLLEKKKEVRKIGIVLVSSNRGLCGSFNQQVIKAATNYLKQEKGESQALEFEFITMGKKGARTIVNFGYSVVAEFDKADVLEEVSEIRPLAKIVTDDYLGGKYDRVVLVYTDFVSSLKQLPRVKQILPIERVEEEMLGVVGEKSLEHENIKTLKQKDEQPAEYLFEPDPQVILDELLPRLLEVQIFQALLESNASEHSARMLAMRNASDAAGDMIDELTLTYNQARQAAITKEIAEIAGGKAALE